MLTWRRLGFIFDVRGRSSWMHHFAQNPNPVVMGDRLRVFFTCRPERAPDGSAVSRIGWCDLDRADPTRVLGWAERPVFELGGPGTFDEFGAMPGGLVYVQERKELWLYYVGWSRAQPTPYRWTIGLAVSQDDGRTFARWSNGPLLGMDRDDPYLLACPRVWRHAPDQWLMLYQSGTGWNLHDNHWESVYVARRATSRDGLNWIREPGPLFPAVAENECQTSSALFSRPGHPGHNLLFSWRHGIDFRNPERGYRLGYASSEDLVSWRRDDRMAGLAPAASGWDSEMICYPGVVEVDGRVLLFYCGNEFGKDGFGAAELIG